MISEESLYELHKKRYQYRQQFYDNYSTESYDMAILDCKAMLAVDKKILHLSKDINEELEYGATVCLYARMCLMIGEKKNARLTLENYLSTAEMFLSDVSWI